MEQSTPTVFIVEDDIAICNALDWLLKSIHLTARIFHNGTDFLHHYQTSWKGCLLLDIRMPQMSGLELQERLNALHNTLPIIFMTGHGDIPMAVRAMKAGAFDFITKPFNNHILLEQIQKAILDRPIKTEQTFIQSYAQLTRRETQVLQHITEGLLNKQIGSTLNISTSTVEMHRANVMRKLKMKSVVELIKQYTLNKDYLPIENK